MKRVVLPVGIVALLLAVWQAAASWDILADAFGVKPFLIPSPADIADSLWEDRSLLADNAWVTLREILGGLAIALVAGLAFALVLHVSDMLRRAFYPLLVATQAVPTVAIAPILVVWFGYGAGPKLAIIALVCFFPVTVNTLDGLRSVDPELVKMMRTLDAGRLTILRRVEAPSALPFVFSGMKIAAVIAAIGAVFGEWAGASSGLGHLILISQSQLQTARVFAAVTVLAAFAIALFAALTLLERRVAWWGTSAR
jgi:ABC-type nitrate/sulfonate/bicarbonate transport system permease component